MDKQTEKVIDEVLAKLKGQIADHMDDIEEYTPEVEEIISLIKHAPMML